MPRRLLEVVRDAAMALVTSPDLPVLLFRLTEHATALSEAYGAGILLRDREGRLRFGGASRDEIIAIERHQAQIQSGIGCDAFERDEVLITEDLTTNPKWPRYGERACETGMCAVAAVPMHAYGHTIGVLDVYRKTTSDWDEETLEILNVLATLGAGYVAHAAYLRDHRDLTDQLQRAIDTRDLIGQAKGVVMTRMDVDATTAFAMLRTCSQRRNVKLRDIAAAVIEGRIDIEDL